MKRYTCLLHSFVRFFNLEYSCFRLSYYWSFFIKAIPLPQEYNRGEFLKIKRDETFFNVDRSDYMQWHIYSGLPDISWKKAASVVGERCVVLDIGANCGQFSLKLASALFRKGVHYFAIHAFEPNPAIYQLLVSNLGLNATMEPTCLLPSVGFGECCW